MLLVKSLHKLIRILVKYFEKAIPSDVFINVMVVSEADDFLVLRRSRSVASAQGKWCVGSFETMEYSLQNTAKADKNFHILTQRCLKEELNLYQQERKDNIYTEYLMTIYLEIDHFWRQTVMSLTMLLSMVVSANGIGESDYSQIILYGQSLSMGWECPIAISTIPISGNYMVGSSPMINHGNDGARVLNPLVAVKSTVGGEQPIVGCVNAFSQLYRKFVNKEQKFIASSAGEGGQSIERLSKGCTNATDQDVNNNYYHREFLKLLDYTYEAVGTLNQTVEVPAILYMQGEHNYFDTGLGMTPGTEATKDKEEYKAYLLQLKNDMQTDIMQKYGQTYRPLFFIYEVCGAYINIKEMPINMAQIEFALENDDVFLLNPTYFTPDYWGGHLSSNGYRWYGEIMAKTLYNVMIDGGQSKSNISPIDFTAKDNQIFIKFSVPVLPLVFDTWTKEEVKNYGFRAFLDGTEITINSLSIDDNVVILNCDTPIRGDLEITYAGQGRNGSGNLRDSDDFQAFSVYYDDSESQKNKPENYTPKDKLGNKIYGQYYPLYNWCPNFYKRVEIEGEMTKYLLTYIVDGEDYKKYEIEYGSTITPEPAPTGWIWSEIPETMPAHDVVVTATFAAINKGPEGDANGDGDVNMADVDYVIECIFEALDVSNKAADVNDDGYINVADVVYIIKRIK